MRHEVDNTREGKILSQGMVMDMPEIRIAPERVARCCKQFGEQRLGCILGAFACVCICVGESRDRAPNRKRYILGRGRFTGDDDSLMAVIGKHPAGMTDYATYAAAAKMVMKDRYSHLNFLQ